MPKINAIKVSTPGSQGKLVSPGRGRPPNVEKNKEKVKKKKKVARYSRKGNYRNKYRPEDMLAAIQAVKNGEMSSREAARQFEVPRTSLQDRLSGKSGDKVGRPTELLSEEETLLVERILLMGTWGFPLSRMDLARLIQAYLNSKGKTTRNVK